MIIAAVFIGLIVGGGAMRGQTPYQVDATVISCIQRCVVKSFWVIICFTSVKATFTAEPAMVIVEKPLPTVIKEVLIKFCEIKMVAIELWRSFVRNNKRDWCEWAEIVNDLRDL